MRSPGLQRACSNSGQNPFAYRDGPRVALAGGKRRGKRTEVGTRAREASIVDAASGKSTSLWPLLSAPRHSLLIFEEEGRPTALNGAVQEAGDRLQVLRLDGRCDPQGEVRDRYRMRSPGWVLVRSDQVVAARGAGTDFSALDVYAAQVLRPRPAA